MKWPMSTLGVWCWKGKIVKFPESQMIFIDKKLRYEHHNHHYQSLYSFNCHHVVAINFARLGFVCEEKVIRG